MYAASDPSFPKNSRLLSSRLNAGLSLLAADEHEPALSIPPQKYFRATYDPLLANWNEERLNPSSCNLRAIVLVYDGQATGAKSLAQETTPPLRAQ